MISPGGAKKALLKRTMVQPKPILLDPNFGPQNEFINDGSRFIVAQCSRRSGKTNGLAIRFFKTLEKHPRSQCVYLALTRESAKDIMWPVLQELNTIHQLGCTFVDSTLTMTHSNGAKLRLLGADMSNFIKRLRGRKYPGVAIDEAQDFSGHLQSLIDDVLTPATADYEDGWIALTGTPGPVPQGYFFDITQRRRYGYSFHGWTLYENPYMPNPQAFVEELKLKREWEDTNPTLLREYRNKWVLDVESLWVRYKEDKNHFQELPKLANPHRYDYILGIDIGFRDADALAVLAFTDASPTTYLIEELITTKQDVTDLANQIKDLQQKYGGFSHMVMDAGALGIKVAEELRRRFQLPLKSADKTRKQENVEFLNDALRTGKFKAKSGSRFAQDSFLVQIDWDKTTPDKIVVKKNYHSDIIDAVLYGFKLSPAYAYQDPPKRAKAGTPEWVREEEDRMKDDHIERLKAQDLKRSEDPWGDNDSDPWGSSFGGML
jgi:hypothetical protein